MKHFLRLMGQLCPISNLYKTKLTAIVAVMALFMCLIAAIQAPAQTGAAVNMDEIKPLQIGDTIPEELWHLPLQVVNHPEGRDTIRLNEYRDKKLIILDFWATWCVPCISSLDKLDSLQNQLNSKLAVVPTTFEDPDRVEPLVKKRGWSLATAVSENFLKPFFPHRSVPHQVWIKDNTIRAITDHNDATTENIHRMLEDDTFALDTKNDVLDYSNTTTLSVLAKQVGTPVLFSSALTGHINGIPTSAGRTLDGDTAIVFFTNVPLMSIYREVLNTTNNRITVDLDSNLNDATSLFYGNEVYSYQLKYAKDIPRHTIDQRILDDLNTCFNLELDSHIVEMDCYVISDRSKTTLNDNTDIDRDKATCGLVEYRLLAFVKLLNFTIPWTPQQPIFIDESNRDIKIMTARYDTLRHDPQKIKAALLPFGLDIKKEKRPVLLYTISSGLPS